MLEQEQVPMQNGGADSTEDSAAATQTASENSGAISKALMKGVASGAAIISTGIHAAAEAAGLAKSGDVAADGGGTSGAEREGGVEGADAAEKDSVPVSPTLANGEAAADRAFKLQFGTVDDKLVSEIVSHSGDETVSAKNSSYTSTPNTLSPMPSQAIDAKPFTAPPSEQRALENGAVVKSSFGSLNVNAREFTPSFGALADANSPAGAHSEEVSWSNVGITDESEAAVQGANQWDYGQQMMWSEDHQDYGTYVQRPDGVWVWYSAQYAGGWDNSTDYQYWDAGYANGGYYMNGNGGSRSGRWNGHANSGSHAGRENAPPATGTVRAANGALPADAAAGNGAAKRDKRKEKRRESRPQQPGLKETYGAEAVQGAALAVLEEQYPAYSRGSLREMLSVSNSSLARALDMLAGLEAEHLKHRKQPKADKTPALVLDEENFPSLSAASSPAPSPVKPTKRQPAVKHINRPGSPDSPLPNGATTPATPRSASPALGSTPSGADAAALALESCATGNAASNMPSEYVASVTAEAPSAAEEEIAVEAGPAEAAHAAGGASTAAESAEAPPPADAAAAPQDAEAAEGNVREGEGASKQDEKLEADNTNIETAAVPDQAPEAADAPTQAGSSAAEGGEQQVAPEQELTGAQAQSSDSPRPASAAEEGAPPAWVPAAVPQVPAWSRKEKPAFLLASRDEPAPNAAPAQIPPLFSPAQKRAVPISQGAASGRKGQGSKSGKEGSSDAPWVATGAAADTQYSEARSDARDHMRARNTYFQQATQAYLAGDKALAKELGAKGRWHAQQMLDAHASASETIFRQRNKGAGGNGGPVVIDLHGQHVAEAIKLLRRELSRLRRAGGQNRLPAEQGASLGAARTQRVQILVGTNHHSKAKHSAMRLPAAVEDFLTNEGISFKKPVEGAIEINA